MYPQWSPMLPANRTVLYDLSTVCVLCCTDGMALAVDPTGDRIDKEEGSNFSATLVAFHSESGRLWTRTRRPESC